jgi:hypothetical protein
MKEFMPIALIH